jgi:DNA-binding NtrC family response regulator
MEGGGQDHGQPEANGELLSLHAATRRFQRELVRQALDRSQQNVSAAARALKITRAHMYNLMASFGLRRGGTTAAREGGDPG